MSIIAQFYPNGEFTHGVDTSKRKRSRLERLSDKCIHEPDACVRRDINADINAEIGKDSVSPGAYIICAQRYKYIYLGRTDRIFHYAVEPLNGLEPYLTELEHHPLRWAQMTGGVFFGSSDGENFTQTPKPSPRKAYKFTSRLARTIRNAAYLLEQTHGKDNLSFLTLTLPDLPPEGLAACAANWGKMVDKFLKWLRAKIERQFGELHYTYCTEVQPKRLTERGEYALHLHLLFVGRISSVTSWYITPRMARKEWVRCIKSVYPGDFKQNSLESLQKIKKSAAAYLGKYLSKGTNVHKRQSSDADVSQFRGHWGGVSRNLRRRIRHATLRLTDNTHGRACLHTITRFLHRCTDSRSIKFYISGFIPTNGESEKERQRGLHVGVGCLRKPLLEGGYVDFIDAMLTWWESQINEEL